MNEIVYGRRMVTPETALRLARFTGRSNPLRWRKGLILQPHSIRLRRSPAARAARCQLQRLVRTPPVNTRAFTQPIDGASTFDDLREDDSAARYPPSTASTRRTIRSKTETQSTSPSVLPVLTRISSRLGTTYMNWPNRPSA